MNGAAALVISVVLAFLAAGCSGDSEARNRPEPEARPVAVATAAVEERALPNELDVTGTLAADAQAEVASEGAGRVVEVFVERGTPVRAGALLARLDAEDAQNALREAEAVAAQTQARLGLGPSDAFDAARTPDAQKARATLERAQADHDRYTRLLQQDLVARAEYDLRRADWLTAAAQYEASLNEARQLHQALRAQRARAAIARRALADMEVRAPWDGVVAEKHATAGQFVTRGARVATLVRTDPLRIELSIPESAVAAVRRGQKVAFSVQSRPDARFEGVVTHVGPALRADARALVVEAMVPNRDGRLVPGLFATAHVELPAARPALFVPAAAVRTDAGVSRLWVVRDGHAELRLVQPGRARGGSVEIVRGLAPGETVVAVFTDRLGDGSPVAAGR